MVRKKPIPGYRRTLPQQYQRWLYEDYTYLWTQQTIATKREYAAAGVRHHLTGFQYWLKYQLTNLPDIVAMWHLDERLGAIAHDSSRQGNHATIIGTTPVTGVIASGRYFDGLNDYLFVAHNPTLNLGTQDFTIEAFIRPTTIIGIQTIIVKRVGANFFHIYLNANRVIAEVRGSGLLGDFSSNPIIIANAWQSVILYRSSGTGAIYVAGIDRTFGVPANTEGNIDNTSHLEIGAHALGTFYQFNGDLDHIVVYNRALDPAEILRHSLRRYPA